MPHSYRFAGSYATWPTEGGPARKGSLLIVSKGDEPFSIHLSAGELRNLVRESLRALAYTKVEREPRQWEATWDEFVDRKIEPIMSVVDALLPKSTGS